MRVHHPSGKLCKLIQHVRTQQKGYAGEDIAFCPRDFLFIKENDVVEIYNPDEDVPRLLLKVTKGSLRDDFTPKDAVSIEQSIAVQFQLKNFPDVIINKIDVASAELDSLELTFKDQYLGRNEMWRLKNSLVNTCLYLNKRIEFGSSTIRCQVCEMWSHGDKVSCGVVTSATKVVFRSCSSMVYLFIQMSSEMWDFDIYGDLYFEKAVNGFLAELFAKWKKNGSNHEVTIVLFSRLYYLATCLEQFPENVRQCLQIDYKGRYYEDYYRVAVQNEKYDDWGGILTHLKHLFVEYQSSVLNSHSNGILESGRKLPKAYISSAAQGNVLEVLNMSLNVFEKHYMDRSFDRTGQLSVVITPGVGVFEVDRELTNVTMQRVIDNGVGSDLVCVGEQPLHAVPLLKFHNKTTTQSNVEDYSMPHWINQSFYSSNKMVGYSTYVPRIKLPTTSRLTSPSRLTGWDSLNGSAETSYPFPKPRQNRVDTSWPNSVYDFDDYDAKVFQVPNVQPAQRRSVQRKNKSTMFEISIPKTFRRQNSEPDIYQGGFDFVSPQNSSVSSSGDKSSSVSVQSNVPLTSTPIAIAIPNKKFPNIDHMYSSSFGALNIELKPRLTVTRTDKWYYDDFSTQTTKAQSSESSSQGGSPKERKTVYSRHSADSSLPSRALINPFDPSHAVIKLTSNRRRWTHIFPRGPTGALIQQHHFQSSYPKLEIVHEGVDPVESPKVPVEGTIRPGRNSLTMPGSEGTSGKQKLTLLWGATGEQEWSCALQTGVDWKSLTIPACLPITTDYFPDERSLQIDFVVSDYNLLPDDVNADYAQQKAIYRRPLTTKEVYEELVAQRLAQGFQLIVRSSSLIKAEKTPSKYSMNSSVGRANVFANNDKEKEEHCLSIGRVFHKISLDGSTINVTRYRPKHAYPSIKIHYRYQFHAPNSRGYEASWVEFSTEKLENYNWNYLDHYICTRGDRDFVLVDSLKYWRFRMLLLPSFQAAARKIQDGVESANLYAPLLREVKTNLVDGFLKFVEQSINRRIRRPNISGKKPGLRVFGPANPPSSQIFRERLGSNRVDDRPRSRSISKGTEKWTSPKQEGSGTVSPCEGSGVDKKLPNTEIISETNVKISENSDEMEFRLKSNASLGDIMDVLRSPNSGFYYAKSEDLPKLTFVSSDATLWLTFNMEGMPSEAKASEKFNEMVKEHLICHASGNTNHPFIVGFYLYFIVASGFDDTWTQKPRDLGMFQNEWMEVKIYHDRVQDAESPINCQSFRQQDVSCTMNSSSEDAPNYREVYLDVDRTKNDRRQEWGHLRYLSAYRPDEAFEMVVQWVQATGSVITEMVQSWARKAQQCNMQLIPIPNDPFALPSSKSDSLRGPIFIALNIESLMGSRSYLFQDFPEETWDTRMFLLQNAIVRQFGFIPTATPELENRNDHQYVHSSGNMFIFIQSRAAIIQGIRINESPCKFQRLNESPAAGSHDDYITRHVTGKNRALLQEENRVGFLWSWNYMVSKRWKTSSTTCLGDDSFVLKVLKDFTAFCDNQNNRLTTFWENNLTTRA